MRGCNVRNMNPEKAESLSPELQAALEPLLNAIESLSERIVESNERIEQLAQQSYPKVALLKQIKGVGTLIALTYMLTLEDPHRFRKSRDVGCYLGLQPGRARKLLREQAAPMTVVTIRLARHAKRWLQWCRATERRPYAVWKFPLS